MSYDYKKIFFQRPILTQMNLFLWWFLFFTLLLVIPLAIILVNYFTNLPEEVLHRAYKNYTINRLMQIPRSAIIEDEINEIYLGDLTENLEPEEKPEEAPEREPVHNEIIKEVETPPVVESAPVENPLKKYQDSKKAYDENIKKFAVKEDDKVQIAQPNFTDFGVVQGYRNFEETIMVGSESKQYIERCLDRYFRVQPRFRGKIIVKFDVHPDGHVIEESLKITYSDIEYEPIKECFKKSILRWVSYPPVPKERGIYSVTQKYIF
jgi:hypothetical protein